jgi:O-antigen ligase
MLLLVAGLGLYASLSRAPWMAAVMGLALWSLTSARPGRSFGVFLLVFALVGGAALISPAGDKIIDMIPWIGKTDSENVVYRQRLLEVSLIVLMESPWFGSTEFAHHPLMQTLIQGQGIIDMVNTYLGIAMATGVVGFSLFTGAFLGVLLPLGKALMQCNERASASGRFARVVFVALLLTMFLIFTNSSTHALPWTYYSLMGLAMAAMRLLPSPMAARSGKT